MKANEAPEKLYVNFHFIETHPGNHQPLVTKQGINKYDIKYIREDVFIERVCEFLKSYRQEIYNGQGYIAGIVNDKTIEDFRNYMKEE